MEFKFIENPGITAVNEIRDRLKAYNNQFWEVTDKPQYSLTVNEDGCLVGGLVFSVFGDWLELEFLWVDQDFRGRGGVGKELLARAEAYAKDFGCKTAVVNTMSFQAKPFYEKNEYVLMYTQKNYPKTSSRYYLEKKLT
ncbi:MAG: GNAT family N-acetyltransferase [Sphaerochaeta associata]|jgi:GNAT superfamily N-acetyltransferase|uniref:GNAT family N-acetyltransferase n=1 Tax=Sphaerochaeta associata TaxID=1129264 RepID=UPI002B20C907|nr:GNAT family N-acetyltransferase [Sphaerochaeta associata]MEA5029063.1 GNAT family N-acetyltransferase [Sphaerochaeta associata]